MAFARGVTAFRAGDFLLAHDLWEGVWHAYGGGDRRFLQGLIQVAVGCHHLQCRNHRGARSLWAKAMAKLAAFRPRHWGLDIDGLRQKVERLRAAPDDSCTHADRLASVQTGM